MTDNKETEPNDMMNVEDMDWYKEQAAKDTPGRALRFYRKLKGLTQPELAANLGRILQGKDGNASQPNSYYKYMSCKLKSKRHLIYHSKHHD